MNKLNNKGFTLIEILAVIAIIAIIGLIAIPNVISTLNTSKQASYDILVKDITIAGKQLYEELDFTKGKIYLYEVENGKTDTLLEIKEYKLKLNLQTLVSNGLLTGTNNSNSNNKNHKIVANPKTKEDIGNCEIIITKIIDDNYNTSYEIKNAPLNTNRNCPTDEEYKKALN